MRRSRFSETQIVEILKEGEAGLPVAELLRKHGISRATYFQWKAKYSGATVADLKRLKELEAENSRLKRLYSELALENAALPPGGGAPKTLTPSAKRQVVALLVDEFQLSRRRACRAMGLSRAAWYRPPVEARIRDALVIEALNGLVAPHSRWGFWKCYDRLRLDGSRWNHTKVWRVYRALGLNLPRRSKRRVPRRLRQPLAAPPAVNQVWAVDFMHDALYGGRRFRTLNVLDEGNREGLPIEVGTSIPAARVIRALDQLTVIYGRPDALRLDNGPEITSALFTEWCVTQGIELKYIQPGHPAQNAFIERFNRTYREEVLDAYLFDSVAEVQGVSDEWFRIYNERRPHEALGSVPPIHFQPRAVLRRESTNSVST